MYYIGSLIVSFCIGVLYNDIYGWLTLGGAFMVVGVWVGIDDSIVKYNKSKHPNPPTNS